MNPIDPKETAVTSWAQWFNRAASHYSDPRLKMAYITDVDSGQPVHEDVMRSIYFDIWNKLDAKKNDTILDVGCGVGYLTKHFFNKVKKIVGMDVSFAMVQSAYSINPGYPFLVGKADAIPFSCNSFNRVVCYSVFQYLKDKDMAIVVLDEFIRIQNSPGCVFIGDVLEPFCINSGSKEKTNKWWPENLNHNLEKLTLPSDFFKGYCKKNKFKCEIIEQNLPDRNLEAPRYDVIIRSV